MTIFAGRTSAFFAIDVPADAVGASGLPSENLEVTISAPAGNPIFGATAQTLVANSQPVSGNPAVPVLEDLTPLGTFTGSGTAYTLNLGRLPFGDMPQIELAVVNAATAPANDLAGTFTTSGSAVDFGGDGRLPILRRANYGKHHCYPTTGSLGFNSATLTFAPEEFNASGYEAQLSDITLTVE